MQWASLGWVDPPVAPGVEALVPRLWLVPPWESGLRKAKREKDREAETTSGPASGPPAFKGDQRGRRAEQGLDDHGLQQAEAHHEVQRDGRLQVVPVQPQVAEVWHVLQI